MKGMIRLLTGGLVILMAITLSPVLLQSTNHKSESQPLNGWADNSQTQSGLVLQQMGQMPLAFTKNEGQWNEQALYKATTGGATVWITREGTYYQFTRRIPRTDEAIDNPRLTLGIPDRERFDEPDRIETMAIKTSLVGANANLEVVGEELMEYRYNYFIGDDPANWHTDVPNYKAVCLKEAYPGIDLRYYGTGRQLEYDFVVSPGADPSQIRIEYEGVNSISVNIAGELVIETDWTTITEQNPEIYQIVDGKQKQITGNYDIVSSRSFGFRLSEDYDPEHPLVIDPVISLSTYLGGTGGDIGHAISLYANDDVYMIGRTSSLDFPTNNPADDNFDGWNDVFVSKYSNLQRTLVYSTYLGGTDDGIELGTGIAVDSDGSAYITGRTSATDYPTINALKDELGGTQDAFVSKLSPAGNSLVYSTYLGGSNWDEGYSIAVDTYGSAYVTGMAGSSDFPTANAYDASHNGSQDVFISKLAPSGTTFAYSTYMGGENVDCGYGIKVDASGCAYVTGRAGSGFPVINAYDVSFNGGGEDAFIAKIAPSGSSLEYSTYIGGGDLDEAKSIAIDIQGNAYITGITTSSDFPTANAYDNTYNVPGWEDAFITKLSATGLNLLYSTYLGGGGTASNNGWDEGWSICVDLDGCAYVTGMTNSVDFPIQNALDDSYGEGNDAYVTKLSSDGIELEYSTYLGGSGQDWARGIVADQGVNVFVIGQTTSANFPTLFALQDYAGGGDVFLTKIADWVCFDSDGDSYGDPDHTENECPTDNCPTVYNPEQVDIDSDGLGDICDNCMDFDFDGYGDPGFPENTCLDDNCPNIPNPDQADNDADGTGNACDPCDCTYFCDLDLNGSITPLDVITIVNYVYRQLDSRLALPTACPRENGDWDCFGGINPTDVAWYVNYVYRQKGDGPCDPCE